MTATDTLREIRDKAWADLRVHERDFDAIVCAGDFHGVAVSAAIASDFGVPLMMICRAPNLPTQSLIVTIGECTPDLRYLYIDDFFTFGHSLRSVFDYIDSSGTPAPVVATYEVNTGKWEETGRAVLPPA
jgi:orotate phosphoribosyltransferase